MNHEPWTKKHQPKKSCDILGQKEAVREIKDFVKNYKGRKKRALLLYGPAGCGKTASVYAIANELGLDILEVNASDTRNQKAINEVIRPALKQQSLFAKSRVILIDELDGIAGREDRGGIATLTRLLEESVFPIIITANDPFDRKFNALRKQTELVELKPLNHSHIKEVIKKICKEEKIKCSDEEVSSFARRAAGDLRGAINDLQVLSQETRKLTKEDIDGLSERNKEEKMSSALLRIFKNSDLKIALDSLKNVNEDLNEVMLWIDENLPYEYKDPESLAAAYDAISKADVFNGRIKRWQYWRFLTYINDLLTGGVAVSKKHKNKSIIHYKPASRILKLYIAKMRYMKREAIAQKIAEKTHASTRRVKQDTLPYLKVIFQNNDKEAKQLADEFNLDKEEIEWLKK